SGRGMWSNMGAKMGVHGGRADKFPARAGFDFAPPELRERRAAWFAGISGMTEGERGRGIGRWPIPGRRGMTGDPGRT
ncbi:MAG: hypothetical protein CVT79_18105, partial [Alphaproteobacteria bacterium HGW-Alphaproteobacteria-18]